MKCEVRLRQYFGVVAPTLCRIVNIVQWHKPEAEHVKNLPLSLSMPIWNSLAKVRDILKDMLNMQKDFQF